MGGVLLLAICVFGLLVLFGKADSNRFYKFLIFLIVAPILVSIGISHLAWFWDGSSITTKILLILALPIIVLTLPRMFLPKAWGVDGLLGGLFQAAVSIISFPLRLVWRVAAYVFGHERRSVPLDRYRPAVGTRPPVLERRITRGGER
jgi:hypothetical protein